ncbi:anti-sigma factor [Leucobacter massiliensis]|uniref:Regulator of SigK n=1 Tax=Leucobacter massiliensis TaxID=1686285 RepID=A0A2S9QN40_9MICO|nr:anti-sigma factor [Leucobacter massiliensis]PRI11001.1 hypothetical protein B4915_09000 [Leucobacter massiliensis]
MREQEFRELSAAHALQALSPSEEALFSDALREHPEWQRIVDEDLQTAAALGESSGGIAPPAALRASILDAIEDLPQRPAGVDADRDADRDPGQDRDPKRDLGADRGLGSDRERGGSPRRRRAAWFALAASVAVLLALALALPMRGVLQPPDPVTVALERVESAPDARSVSAGEAGEGLATLHWSDAERQAVLTVEDLPGLADDRDYEAWIVRDGEPISLGVMRPEEGGGGAMLAEGFQPGDALALTVEERGGSPSGLPTSDPVLVVSSA